VVTGFGTQLTLGLLVGLVAMLAVVMELLDSLWGKD